MLSNFFIKPSRSSNISECDDLLVFWPRHFWGRTLGLMFLAASLASARAQTPVNPTPDQLIQLLRSQPAVDISAPVTASASFDPPLVRPGEKSIYRITFNATEVSVQLPVPILAPPQLKIIAGVSGQNMQLAGGAIQMFSTFNYEVRATEPGRFTLPEFTVEVYGKPVTVPASQLAVQNDLPPAHEPVRELFVEPSATNVFAGETFGVSVCLPATSENRVEGVSQLELNGDGFLVQKNPVRQAIQMLEINGRKAPTYIYETTVTPMATGQLKLIAQGFTAGMQFGGPVTLTGQASIAGGPPQYILLDSEPVVINVRPLPTAGELPGFTGAVGNYTCDPPSLATNWVTAGEPVELTVVIRGQKNLARINPPLPPRIPGWQIFPATRDGLVGGVGTNNLGTRFAYTMIPLTTDLHATPAIPFSSFDPVRGKYIDLTIPPVPITVLADGATADPDTALMLSENTPALEKKTSLSRLAPSPGRTADSLTPWQRQAWFPFIQLLPVLGFCGLRLWDRRRRYLKQHPEIIRRRQARRALRRELRLLEQAALMGDADGFIRCAINSLQIVCAPHYPAAPRALVGSDVLQILTGPEREGKAGEIVRRFFAAADATAFASTAGTKTELFAEKSALQEILASLEARL